MMHRVSVVREVQNLLWMVGFFFDLLTPSPPPPQPSAISGSLSLLTPNLQRVPLEVVVVRSVPKKPVPLCPRHYFFASRTGRPGTASMDPLGGGPPSLPSFRPATDHRRLHVQSPDRAGTDMGPNRRRPPPGSDRMWISPDGNVVSPVSGVGGPGAIVGGSAMPTSAVAPGFGSLDGVHDAGVGVNGSTGMLARTKDWSWDTRRSVAYSHGDVRYA